MTATELWRLLTEKLGQRITPHYLGRDSLYACPTREWVTGEFADAFGYNLEALGVSKYAGERNDCDKFSLYATAFARLLNARSTANEVGIAFGFIDYVDMTTDPLMPQGHSINLFVVEEEGEFRLVFWSPQTRREVRLTAEEIATISAVYI